MDGIFEWTYYFRIDSMRVLILFLIGITTSLQAQLLKGDKSIGGTAIVSSILQRDDFDAVLPAPRGSYIQYSPALGFVLNEKYAIGAIASITTRLGYVFRAKENIFGIGGFGRRYIRISDQFIFALSGQLVYNRMVEKNREYNFQNGEYETLKEYANGFSTEITPLFIFFPTPVWGFEAGIGSVAFRMMKSQQSSDYQYDFSAGYGQLRIGLNYYLKR
jgi:hypothetical protein